MVSASFCGKCRYLSIDAGGHCNFFIIKLLYKKQEKCQSVKMFFDFKCHIICMPSNGSVYISQELSDIDSGVSAYRNTAAHVPVRKLIRNRPPVAELGFCLARSTFGSWRYRNAMWKIDNCNIKNQGWIFDNEESIFDFLYWSNI